MKSDSPLSHESVESTQLLSVKKTIPPECFEKKPLLSIYYLLRDLSFLALCYWLREPFATSSWLTYLIWVNVVGFFGWCLFVVGHDCGHTSFSDSYLLNQVCGHIAHIPLLVPFNGWKCSHHHHHLNHNHTENDHGWKMVTKSEYDDYMALSGFESLKGKIRFSPIFRLLIFHYYLFAIPDSYVFSGSHFNPYSRLFKTNQQRVEAAVSSLLLFGWVFFLLKTFPFTDLVLYYVVPVWICSAWLSLVTFLHHTHPDSKFYNDQQWNYFKGALTTIDRSYGSILDHLHHNIETHVVHHLFFTSIPHYNLKLATEAVKPVLGESFFYDTTPWWKAYWISATKCSYATQVENSGVYMFPKDQK